MAHYYTLIQVEGEELVSKAHYTNGKKAAKIASRLSKRTGRKYQVRKIDDSVGDPNWRAREQSRFDNGEYLPLHHRLGEIVPPDHFAHIAKKDPNLIAYTKDDLKGREDKQSIATIEAWLDIVFKSKHFKDFCTTMASWHDRTAQHMHDLYTAPSWREDAIRRHREYATQFTQEVQFAGPVENFDNEDEVNAVAQAIEEVYTNHAHVDGVGSSCMRYDPNEEYDHGYPYCSWVKKERVHPVIAYASPDLAVAYLTNKHGQTVARCLVWPEKKVYGRMYATNDALHNALKGLGYSKCDNYYGRGVSGKSLKGARIRKIENDRGGYVMPYIDGYDHSVGDHDDARFFTLYGGQYNCETTDGTIDADDDTRQCEHCGDHCDESDMYTVYTDASRRFSAQWCVHCRDSYAFFCHGFDQWFSEETVESAEVDGRIYSQNYVDRYANYCNYYDEFTFDDTYQVVIDDCGNRETWGERAVDEYAVMIGGAYYSTEHLEVVDVVTERYVARTPHAFRTITREGHSYHEYISTGLVYFIDSTVRWPLMVIEQGDVDAYLGVDGRYYKRGYVDNYPTGREPVAEDKEYPCWVFTYLDAPHPTATRREQIKEAEMLMAILEEERRFTEENVSSEMKLATMYIEVSHD